ncbi:MAG TPA: UDP-N-acetylmuramoyl-tripeptide--D-alanyl-D-alanine ligase [Anaerolineae bacterium]|nr:UDP-N-acetylmuramoyl-tripeptide--D-alanyl-D-alanine ligase [Anaerolineae bacterium]HIQ06132.1 UDP-N-acetylmuramoyl-tripeptide--D-alanyl-D-alanine ligase [Anaerolineae bacterium]
MLWLKDIAIGLGCQQPPPGLPEVAISQFVIDSRAAKPGACFIALQGERQDGHQFIGDALSRGAVAVIAEARAQEYALDASFLDIRAGGCLKPRADQPIVFIVEDSLAGLQRLAVWWRRHFTPRVVGITGSVGKTTTKEMVAAVLSRRYRTLKSYGNFNNEIGLPLTLLELTPAHERVVLEMGMYAVGEIGQLAEIAQPHVGVVTNVGPTHLERLGSLERIAEAKAELVQALPPAPEGIAILNADDPAVRAMAMLTQARVFTYGLTPESDLWASHIESAGLEGIRFRFHYRAETLHVRVPLLGRHSVHTALRAAAVGLVEGLDWEEIVAGLSHTPGQLRLLVVPGLHGATLIDDTYNASPASTIAALNLLEDLSAGRRIAVLGDMLELGEYEEEGHRKVGRRAADVVDKLVTVGPRARIIAEEAVACGLAPGDVRAVDDNQAAVDYLRRLVGVGDVVLIKGSRGQAMETIVAALSQPRGRRGEHVSAEADSTV